MFINYVLCEHSFLLVLFPLILAYMKFKIIFIWSGILSINLTVASQGHALCLAPDFSSYPFLLLNDLLSPPLSLPWESLPPLQCQPESDLFCEVIFSKSTHVPSSGIIKRVKEGKFLPLRNLESTWGSRCKQTTKYRVRGWDAIEIQR